MATNPFNYPEAATKGYTVNAYQEAFIGINGQYTMSTDPIKNMAFNKRLEGTLKNVVLVHAKY